MTSMKFASSNLLRIADIAQSSSFIMVAMRNRTSFSSQDRADQVDAREWDALSEAISALFARTPSTNLPQGKAEFARTALDQLARAMDSIYPEVPDEAVERHLSRVLEQICHLSDTPPTTLALDLYRLRAWRLAGDR